MHACSTQVGTIRTWVHASLHAGDFFSFSINHLQPSIIIITGVQISLKRFFLVSVRCIFSLFGQIRKMVILMKRRDPDNEG